MPFFDWIELGGYHPENFSGKCGVTIGDTLAACFGARHTHIFGPEIKLVCDPEDLVIGRLEEYLPVASALFSGLGGNVTWVYGSNVSATYVGPKVDIRRAPTLGKTSDNVIARTKRPDIVAKYSKEKKDPIDKATVAVVSVLSVLAVGVSAALDLVIHFQYNELNDTKDEEKRKGYEHTIETLKVCSYTISGRLLALLKLVEEQGSWAEFAKKWALDAKLDLIKIELFAIVGAWYVAQATKNAAKGIASAAKAAGKALSDCAEEIGAVAAVAAVVAGTIAIGAATDKN